MPIAVLLLGLLLDQTRDDEDKVPPPSAEYVEVQTKSSVVHGFVVTGNPELQTLRLIAAQGDWLTLEQEDVVEFRSRSQRFVTEIPAAPLVQGLGDEDPWIRDRCQSWVVFQTEQAQAALGAALGARDADKVRRVLEVLRKEPQTPLAPAIKKCLSHADERVRARAIDAYAGVAPQDAVRQCRKILDQETSGWVRNRALVSLVQAVEEDDFPFLLELLEKEAEAANRRAIVRCLKKVSGKDYGDNQRYWRNWWNVQQRVGAREVEE